MKVEIAENLIYSYLKHIEGCRIVQTNWKVSGKWIINDYEKHDAIGLFNKIQSSSFFSDIFGKNTFNQLIKQAEIDVLGINTIENSVFGIDVAYHSGGLNYGDTTETINRVLKKIFRTILVMKCYFKRFDKFNCYFITPEVPRILETRLNESIEKAITLINDDAISIAFISRKIFFDNILKPVKSVAFEEHDTMELFVRASKLIEMEEDEKEITHANLKKDKDKNSKNQFSDKRTIDGMKIGQYVQLAFKELFEKNLLTDKELTNLQDKSYSKSEFNQLFEIIRPVSQGCLDANGRSRYYSDVYGGKYLLTSQWFERHWDTFLHWYNKMKK